MSEEQAQVGRLPFQIETQYVKDLSFENPNFLSKSAEDKAQPEMGVNVETQVAKLEGGRYEVSMDISVKASLGGDAMFVLELTYAAVVAVAEGLDRAALENILLVHCPFLIFPFAREIVSNMTRCGGYPPLMIEPVDFAAVYMAKKKEMEGKVA